VATALQDCGEIEGRLLSLVRNSSLQSSNDRPIHRHSLRIETSQFNIGGQNECMS